MGEISRQVISDVFDRVLRSLDTRRAILQREATEAGERLRRLYKLVEDGMAEMDDRIAR